MRKRSCFNFGRKAILSLVAFATFLTFTNAGFSGIIAANKLPPAVARGGLVAFWPADGNANDIINGHDGILINGATFSDGILGLSFDLDNTAGITGGWGSSIYPPIAFDGGSYVSVPDSDAWAFGQNDFTIQLWANFNSVPVYDIGHAQGGVFISHDEGPYDVNKWFFALGGGVLNFHINDPIFGPVFLIQAPFTPELNQWYHFAITRRHNIFTIYVNGVAVGLEENDRVIPDANAPLNIGEAEGYYFNGLLDNVGIYNRALSAGELKAIYKANVH